MKEQIEQLKNDITECYGCDPMYYGTDGDFLAKELVEMGWRKQKEGEWVLVEKEDFIYQLRKCSVCGYSSFFNEYGELYQFCPNCGSKMKGGAE